MNIRDAAIRAYNENLWIRKRDRTEEFCLHIEAGKVFCDDTGAQVELDARDCMGDDWYLVTENGEEV